MELKLRAKMAMILRPRGGVGCMRMLDGNASYAVIERSYQRSARNDFIMVGAVVVKASGDTPVKTPTLKTYL